jgi:aminomethyltransferase
MKTFSQAIKCYATESLKRTALYDFHVANGGKMVPFAGYEMAVLYSDMGLEESHMWCREHAAMFDVGHMGQLWITGADREAFLESISPGNIKDLKVGRSRLTQFTNENGGIEDDTIITKRDGYIYEVINAACVDSDMKLINKAIKNFKGDVKIELIPDRALIALQGPKAAAIVDELCPTDLSKQPFMSQITGTIDGIENCFLSRLGYTGEDGYEISVPNKYATKLAEKFLSYDEVKNAGLAPRDSLRLESGLCLYGSDMSKTWSVIESNLSWTIGKRRKQEANFPGAKVILDHLKNGTKVLRVGFTMDGQRVARPHYKIYDPANPKKQIGEVTSGTYSFCSKQPVGMCYVDTKFSKTGSAILVDVRGKVLPGKVAEMPFTPSGYYRGE